MADEAERIIRLYSRLKRQYGGLHRKMDDLEKMRNLDHTVVVPKRFRRTTKAVKTPYIPDTLRRLVAILTANYPQVRVPPRGTRAKDTENANALELWTVGCLLQLERQRRRRVWRQSLDAAVGLSIGVMKLTHWPDPWKLDGFRRLAEEDEDDYFARKDRLKRGLRIPIDWTDVDPRSYFPVEDEMGLCEVLQVTERAVEGVSRRYHVPREELLTPGRNGTDYSPNVKFIEDWQREEATVTYMAITGAERYGRGPGRILDVVHHGYPRLPYFPFDGLSTSSLKPEWGHHGVVEHIVPMVDMADEFLTEMRGWARMGAYPMLINQKSEGSLTEGDEGAPDSERSVIEFEAGTSVETTGKVYWLQPPEIGRDMNRMVEFAIRTINEYGGIVPVLRGIAGLEQPGYAIAQLSTAARQVFDPILDNAVLALEEMVGFLWWLVEHKIKEPVPILAQGTKQGQKRWLTVGPEEIDGYYVAMVQIEPLQATDVIALGQFGLQQTQGKLMSKRRHIEENLHGNADEELEEIEYERLLESPYVQQVTDLITLKEAGLLDALASQQGPAPGPPGPTPAGAGPPVPATPPLAPSPGLGMPLTQPTPPPGPGGRAVALRPGRAAGVRRQPPRGVPTEV